MIFPPFGFRARSLCFWIRSGVLFNLSNVVVPKSPARAFGSRELDFILVVMRAEKVSFFLCDFAAFWISGTVLSFLGAFWILFNLSDVVMPKISPLAPSALAS